MYTIYAIYNKKHGKFYIGQTKDLSAARIDLHNSKTFKGCYTAKFDGKWESVYKEKARTYREALAREKQLKSYRGREFIKKTININFSFYVPG